MATRSLANDENGGVLVETTIMISIVLVFVLGSVDFLFAFYQWNAAAKAVEMGARIAAVSAPLANGLNALSTAVVSSSVTVGSAMPSFTVTCDGNAGTTTGSCSCTGACTGVAGFNTAALRDIVYGRGSTSCGDATSAYFAGMCDIFPRIVQANADVRVVYDQPATGGLGYAGRAGGPVPTITVSIQNLPFQFFFLGSTGLLGSSSINMPGLRTTISGEDLCSVASC
jgi:TadE-like protein